MRSVAVVEDLVHYPPSNPILLAKLADLSASAIVFRTDKSDLSKRELGLRMAVTRRKASASSGSAFSNHVRRVVHGCSKEQMGWVDAQRNVASMADQHPAWDGTKHHLVDSAVGASRAITSASNASRKTVPVGADAKIPKPATAVRFGYPIRSQATIHRGTMIIHRAFRQIQQDNKGRVPSWVVA